MKTLDWIGRRALAALALVALGAWTKKEVRELLGPPALAGRLALKPREWWEYKFREYPDYEHRVLWVQFSEDGVAREALDMRDAEFIVPALAR